MAGGKKPDFNVSAVIRNTEIKGSLGVAWKDDDFEKNGRISIKLNPFVAIPTRDPDLFITLFPINENADAFPDSKGGGQRRGNSGGGRSRRADDDEIPF